MRPHAISCIIPTYNSADYLRGALESVFSQTYTPAEIIIADAGSSDGTRELAQEFGEWVRLVWHPRRPHDITLTRQLGVHFASSDFVALLDPSARWRPDKLARQVAQFESQPDLDLSITEVALADDVLSDDDFDLRRRAEVARLPALRFASSTLLARRELLTSQRGRALLEALNPDASSSAFADLNIDVLSEVLTQVDAGLELEPRPLPPQAAARSWHVGERQLQRVRSLFERRGGLLSLAGRSARGLWPGRSAAR